MVDLEVREDKNNQILTPKEISKILKISMDKTYELIQSPGFPKLKIGRQYRIPKEEFDKWVKSVTTQNICQNQEIDRKRK